MSNDKAQVEELKKLEDEAYFELCQIIAEALQFQDIELLNSRISSWKNKYKKLLDGSTSSQNFKKRIEFLLTQYYSSVTQYILGQIKIKEDKKIENQSKALRELYLIIKDTNDLDLLKKKVKEWENKYPKAEFLKMYQGRIASYTRQKNLEDNAFNQREAFDKLVQITKINATIDELKIELSDWEKEYSINDKYTIDDFIKHKTEVKRFSSDEYLQSIAKQEEKSDIDILPSIPVESHKIKSSSDLSKQVAAYTTLMAIVNKPKNVNEIFNWVYKNSSIKFNDKYKELILNATHLDYSPSYLSSLSIPEIDIFNSSLSFEQYSKIDEIKRYAIISYFNLLLPHEIAIPNNYFNKNVEKIYRKSRELQNIKPVNSSDFLGVGFEISLINNKQNEPSQTEIFTNEEGKTNSVQIDETLEINIPDIETLVEKDKLDDTESVLQIEANNPKINSGVESDNVTISEPIIEAEASNSDDTINYDVMICFSPEFFNLLNNYSNQAILISKIDNITTKYAVREEKQSTLDIDKTKNENFND